jgi:hypothetical protein
MEAGNGKLKKEKPAPPAGWRRNFFAFRAGGALCFPPDLLQPK